MKAPSIVLSDMAVADLLEQADWYEAQANSKVAERWQRAVTSALLRISHRPAAGVLCRFHSYELAGTCRAIVSGFAKHVIFYRIHEKEIFVLRVLHGARDWESLFTGSNPSDKSGHH